MKTNTNNNHSIERNLRKYVYTLTEQGLTPEKIVERLAFICNCLPPDDKHEIEVFDLNFLSPDDKHTIEDFAFSFLIEKKFSKLDAAKVIEKAFMSVIEKRGMEYKGTFDNIQYYYIKNMNTDLQVNTVEHIAAITSSLPEVVKKTIHQIYFFDVASPLDKSWQIEYKEENERFVSIASANNNTGNIYLYMTQTSCSKETIFHESGHCLDINHILSESKEYKEAISNDHKTTGKKSITEYGLVSIWEDFADSFTAYMLGILDGFPNRKKYFDKLIHQASLSQESNGVANKTIPQNNFDIIDLLDEIISRIDKENNKENFGIRCLRAYAKTGNINYIIGPENLKASISRLPMNDVSIYVSLKEQELGIEDYESNIDLTKFTRT